MAPSRKQIRILIADDHPIFRHGLRALLEREPDFAVVGEAADGSEVIHLARKLRPNILLLDLAMPQLHGLESLRKLSTPELPTRTIVLTVAIETKQIVEALQLGARGILLKDAAAELMIKSIRAVMSGEYWVRRESVRDLVQYLRDLAPTHHPPSQEASLHLTERERQIISAVLAGDTNRDISTKLSIGEDTVKKHLTHIFDKTGTSNRLELAIYAYHHGLIGKHE